MFTAQVVPPERADRRSRDLRLAVCRPKRRTDRVCRPEGVVPPARPVQELSDMEETSLGQLKVPVKPDAEAFHDEAGRTKGLQPNSDGLQPNSVASNLISTPSILPGV